MLNEVDWVTILSALLTPTIALCTIGLNYRNGLKANWKHKFSVILYLFTLFHKNILQ